MNDAPSQTAWDLASRPGFLIRRLHQIHMAIFTEECATLGITPVQYSVLSVVAVQPGLEQARLANEVGVDRTTLTGVIKRLELRGLLLRKPGEEDRRLKHVLPTAKGVDMLERMREPALRAHARTIDALPPRQRETFLRALAALVDAGNDYGRAALRLS